jgi:allantoinase
MTATPHAAAESEAAFDRIVIGDVVTSDRIIEGGYVAVRDRRIAAIGAGTPPAARAVSDHRGMLVLPGLVDGHMHTSSALGWPGIAHATRSAAAGGVTTVVDMPYDVPKSVTDASIFREKVDVVNATAHVDVALYGTITKQGGTGAIAGLADAGAASFKLSTYEYDAVRFPRIDHPEMERAFALIAETGLMVAVHNEDQELVERLSAAALASGRTDPIMHCRTRPPLAENLANVTIFEMGLATGAHVHIAHSSLARGFDLAAIYRDLGMKASGEACIQYLCMTEDDIVRLGGRGKCNPPFRSGEEVERMWDRLLKGTVAYVSTDHAPWPADRKKDPDIFKCGAGLTGLQSFAVLMFSLLTERGLSPTLMAKYCAEEPARFHGLLPKKGRIAIGSDADFCVIEKGAFTFDEAMIVDRPECRWSPYHGRAMAGRVAAAYLRGAQVWDGAAVLNKAGGGRFVPRQAR